MTQYRKNLVILQIVPTLVCTSETSEGAPQQPQLSCKFIYYKDLYSPAKIIEDIPYIDGGTAVNNPSLRAVCYAHR